MRLIRWAIIPIVLVGIFFGVWSPGQAQQANEICYSETGHKVSGDFLARYRSASDRLLIYGYPITDEYLDPIQNIRVQYFQRARFELHENAQASQRVQLSPLGEWIYQADRVQPVALSTDTPACRAFISGHGKFDVCYAFLAFFDKHGGLEQFGYPISNYVKEGERYVQYFERARFEWHPELNPDQWVRVADVGRIQFDKTRRDPNLLTGSCNKPPDRGITNDPKNIKLVARAFVTKAVVKTNSQQTLFVIVQDNDLKPVPHAMISATVYLPQGIEEYYTLPASNENGISRLDFLVGDLPVNQVVRVKIDISYEGAKETTASWFRTWW
jgi:hypothetical protein